MTHFGQGKWSLSLLHGSFSTYCTISHTPFASATVTRALQMVAAPKAWILEWSWNAMVILECHGGHSAGMRNKPMVLKSWALRVVYYCSMALPMLTTTHIPWTLPDSPQKIPDPQWKQEWETCISSFKKSKLFTFYNICILKTVLLFSNYYIEQDLADFSIKDQKVQQSKPENKLISTVLECLLIK